MYNHDFNEILSDDRMGRSKEDERFLCMADDSVQFNNGHYEMKLPFKNEDVKLPNNRQLVQQRADNLRRRFNKDTSLHEAYTNAMEKVVKAGYAEKIPKGEIAREDGKVWYIPHHPVYHPQKAKLRIVYDCAATYGGTGLNQELIPGPDLTSSLVGVLLRFRQERVALASDIESMFYQVGVRKEDRDLLRFLWWPGGDISRQLEDYRMNVHIFGASSSPACANYALRKTAHDNKDQFDVEVIDTLLNNFYVDDCLRSTSTEEKATSLAQDLIDICGRGGFRLTKWVSNSKSVLESIPHSERSAETKVLDFDESLPSQKALGMLWLMEPDMFGYKLDIKDRPATRRGMLSVTSSVYDPLGFVSPAILPAKQMLQELCKKKIGWDDKIPEEIRSQWIKWQSSLPGLEEFCVPRCWKPVGFEEPSSVQLHHFSDASESGYGVASYLRLTNHDEEVVCNLVMSKARVAPIKQISIPRMELTAATVAVKVDNMLKRELEVPVSSTVFWTDSQTVLKYIVNDRARYPVFVANRVSVIRDGSDPTQWRYVPTELNPADHASRGLSVQQLLSKHEWLQGPDFLYQSERDWPVIVTSEETAEEESAPDSPVVVNTLKLTPTEKVTVNKLIEHYSDWTGLKRGVAWWLRLKKILLQGVRGPSNQQAEESRSLTAADLQEAEVAILSFVQRQEYESEMSALQGPATTDKNNKKAVGEQEHLRNDNRKKQVPSNSNLLNLDPELDNQGLMTVGGRLRNARIPTEAKHQVILPMHHHVSTLLIMYTHKKLNHQGRNHTIAELRRRYWIVKVGVKVKGLLKKCITCKKVQAKVGNQKMADLPADRVQADDPPFTKTGVDYFGPFEIKVGRTTRKRYGAIFTCFASRAVHIEVAASLDTASCINALRRFISRRGQVKVMYSDNGTNFVGANKELKQAMEEWKTEEIEAFTANQGIHWKFNPPGASHFGGLWERQIRTIRKILQSILTEQHLKTCQSEEQLHTLMCEVEATINSRPLIKTSDDPKDLSVITPNDLLLLQPTASMPPGVFDQKDLYARRRWRQVQYLASIFWKRWILEYLPTLQMRQKWLKPQRNLHVGDIVLIVDSSSPRNLWLMGKVEEVHTGDQGLVRSAKIRTKTSLLTRPVTKLCLLLEQES
ncbi:uncharacterized protein [Amphiura filiformis]|uniref:uncharacterized protein n=1 Tax=Amphiura filiformis TaxID=82378 RepID=UPI003B211CF5